MTLQDVMVPGTVAPSTVPICAPSRYTFSRKRGAVSPARPGVEQSSEMAEPCWRVPQSTVSLNPGNSVTPIWNGTEALVAHAAPLIAASSMVAMYPRQRRSLVESSLRSCRVAAIENLRASVRDRDGTRRRVAAGRAGTSAGLVAGDRAPDGERLGQAGAGAARAAEREGVVQVHGRERAGRRVERD